MFLGSLFLIFKVLENVEIETEKQVDKLSLKIDLDEDGNVSNIVEGDDEEDVLDELDRMDEGQKEVFIERLEEKLEDDSMQKPKKEKIQKVRKVNSSKSKLSGRQEEIMKVFSTNKKVDTDVLNKKIKGITIRTLRRDLDKLTQDGLIKKVGKTRGSYYVKG